MNSAILMQAGKGEHELRAIVAAQAKLRGAVALPILTAQLLYFGFSDSLPEWSSMLAVVYFAYTALILGLSHLFVRLPARSLLLATAVLDPLLISSWLMFTNEYGGLVCGFYLFNILGFGFRAGRQLMHLCQISAIVGFVAVLFAAPYWREHLVIWASFLVPLIIVPLYTGGLIKKLHEARARAELESRAKSDLLARVSHELRTPLTGIISSAELLAAESSDSPVVKRTNTILALGKDLLREISDLLDEAKYEANALKMDLAPMNLRDQIAMIQTTLETTATAKGLEFQVKLDPEIEDLVESDAYYLSRALINLAGNAVKFTDKGRVRVDVDMVGKTDSAYRIRFIVQDTGIGIPAACHEEIFQPFTQANQGMQRRYGGTGLGLTIAKQIVELLGGNMRLDSAPGEGSRFWFELNMRRLAPASEKHPSPAAAPVPRMRVFAADDNETNLHLIRELLEMDGHQVTTASSGSESLAKLAKEEFDILFLDYNLGDMDGIWLVQTYRFGRLKPAPAYFLTADSTVLTASRLKESGAVGVLYKPIGAAELRRIIHEACVKPKNATSKSHPTEATGVLATPPAKPGKSSSLQSSAPGSNASRPILATVASSPLDSNVIEGLRAVSRRPEFLAELLTRAEHDIESNLDIILTALAEKNHAQVREFAHALKGVCASVGAVRLIMLSTNLMRASADELYESRDRLRIDLQDAVNGTVKALRVAAHQNIRPPSSPGNAATLHLT